MITDEVSEYVKFLKNMLLFIQIFPVKGLDAEKITQEIRELSVETFDGVGTEDDEDYAKYGDSLNDNPTY